MKFKKIALSASTLLLAATFSSSYIVQADDDYDEEKYEYYEDDDREEYEYKEHDDDEYEEYDDDEYENYGGYTTQSIPVQETWNNWTRTVSVEKGNLPLSEPTDVTLKVANTTNELSFTIIPRDGELFVPGAAVAETLGATANVYETSQILELKNENTEIIIKANTNVVYENSMKTPLPSITFSMNGDIYVPISALTNGLGYTVKWQAENNTFVCSPTTIQ